MEKPQKKEKNTLNQIKNTTESHSGRLDQVEDRISGLEDKIDIKEKAELLDKRVVKRICKNSETPTKKPDL
jgi:ABC-type hemin transport system substrate-binding protein